MRKPLNDALNFSAISAYSAVKAFAFQISNSSFNPS
jgi:hypothetical protein